MKWDSPIVLTLAGTIAIHTLLLVGADAVMVVTPKVEPEVPPRLELVEIKVEKPKPKEKPKPPPPEVKLDVPEVKPEPVKTPIRATQPQVRAAPPPPEVPQPQNTSPDSGGSTAPTLTNYQLTTDNGQADAIIHKKAKPGRGLGGVGSGVGAGSGAGSASAPPPPPVSVATIKKRALPKGDYGYIDASRDYPPEARQRNIEGAIRVKLTVGEDGKVRDATLLNRLGYGLDELALERAQKIQFDPAIDTDNKAVTSIVIWTFNMTLPK